MGFVVVRHQVSAVGEEGRFWSRHFGRGMEEQGFWVGQEAGNGLRDRTIDGN